MPIDLNQFRVKPQTPAQPLGFAPSPPDIGQPSGGVPSIESFRKQDPWWKDWMTDPLFYILDKFNRPQQALFASIHASMKGDDPVKALGEAFWAGGDTRFVDIMDELGLKGQAGHFDPLDIVAAAGEIFLDPANLIGVGVFAKAGKAAKLARLTADEAKLVPMLEKFGMTIDDVRKAGIANSGELGMRVADEAKRLLGPDAYSHYINVGFGKTQYSIPGSQRLLEPIVKAGRKIRDLSYGGLSAQPRTIEEAIPKALRNVIEKQKSGANQFVAMMSKQLPKEWREGGLAKAIETGKLADDAPDAVRDAFELGSWYSKHLPDLEEMSGVMTRKYGEGGPEFPKAPPPPTPPAGAGAGKAVNAQSTEKGILAKAKKLFSVTGPGQDAKFLTADGDYISFKGPHSDIAKVYGIDILKNAPAEDVHANKFMIDTGSARIVLAEPGVWAKSKVISVQFNRKPSEAQIQKISNWVEDLDAELWIDAIGENNKFLGGGKIERFRKGDIARGIRENTKDLPDYPDLVPKAPPAATAGKVEKPVNTFADFLDMQGLDPDTEESLNYFVHILDKNVSSYMSTNDIRWAKKYRGMGGGLSTKHASQLMREIPGTIDDINTKAATDGIFVFHPKGELAKVWGQATAGQRSSIEKMARDYANENITDDIGSFAAKQGQQIDDLFEGAAHFKTFDKYFVDDWAKATAVRLGRHVQSRAVAETIQQVIDAKDSLTGGMMWAMPSADAPGEWMRLVDKMPTAVKRSLTPEFLNTLENTAFRPDIAETMTAGLKALYDPTETPQWLSTLRKGLSYFRASTILPFGGYHVANFAGNRWSRYLAGVADVEWDLAAGKIRAAINKGDREALSKMTFKMGDKRVTGEEVMQHLFSEDVMTGGSLTAEVAGYGKFAPSAMDIGDKGKMIDLINPVGRKQLGSVVARNMEDHDRVAHFIGRLAKGDTFSEAGQSVDKHLFRYSDLSNIEAGTKSMPGVKDLTLFFTWYRKNMGLTLQKMWEYPGRLSMPIKVRNALNGAFGDPDSEYAVPSYMKDQFYFYLGKDQAGKPRFIDPEKYLPPVSAAKIFGGGLPGAAKNIAEMLIPPIKAGAEMAFNKELFGGKELEGVPGEKQFVFGKEAPPAWAYAVKNIRILNAINKALFPPVERGEGRLRTGEPGKRTPFEKITAGVGREWLGVKYQTSEVQRNRYFTAVSPNGDINTKLDKITSKLAGDVSPLQRDSYMKARSELLWQKAEAIRQMIEDGSDPFTGKPLAWEPPMPAPGERAPSSLRDLYTEMHTTLRELYFGEPAKGGILKVENHTRLKPDELKQTFDTMVKLKVNMLNKDFQYAMINKNVDVLDARVFNSIRDIIKTEGYYDPVRVRQRKGDPPGRDSHVYDYPVEYRKLMVNLFYDYFNKAVASGLIKPENARTRLKNFMRDYGRDYQ